MRQEHPMTPGVPTPKRQFIQRNHHPAGSLGNMLFGLSQVVDGTVRILSLGFLHTTLTLTVARMQSRMAIAALKKNLDS